MPALLSNASTPPSAAVRSATYPDCPLAPEEVATALADLRGTLRADGGDCELLAVEGNRVTVRLRGNCAGCMLGGVTVAGLQQRLIERLGRPLHVISVTK